MQKMPSSSKCLLLFLLCFLSSSHSSTSSTSSTHPDRYLKPLKSLLRDNVSTEYFEVTKPVSIDPVNSSCSLLILQQDFGNTIGSPPATALYSPPSDCPSPWTKIVLEFHAGCKGEQYDRIAGVWVDGVEILRTSTAEPTEAGIFWNVRKDVTRYYSLLQRPNLTLTVMLENIVNDVYTGIYHVNISLLYYKDNETTVPSVPTQSLPDITTKLLHKEGKLAKLKFQSKISLPISGKTNFGHQNANILYEKPAGLIIPVSDDGNEGFWFRIQNGCPHSKEVQIPLNTYKAVLEVYISFHGNDEFWYSNPPNSYIEINNLTTERGNGAFREVFVEIDGVFVGSVVPFPVIFTGGINPLFWEPVVAVGAFNLPTYDLDVTPFLGMILDGKNHLLSIGVTDGIQFWLVDANLHLWLDPIVDSVLAKTVLYRSSNLSIKRDSNFDKLDGSFKIDAKREYEFSGWVNSSEGNLTSYVSHEFKFKNSIKFKNDGQLKEVKQKVKAKNEINLESDTGALINRAKFKTKYPLDIMISVLPGADNNTYLQITNVSHAQNEKSSISLPGGGDSGSSISNSQVSGGWMEVQDHSVLSGAAKTDQTFSYRDRIRCYSRSISVSNGMLLQDNTTLACIASA